jgi:hypothetical protein
MTEYILINGERVLVPAEAVAESRAAVQAWHAAELTRRTIPHAVFASGDAIELADLVPAEDGTARTPDSIAAARKTTVASIVTQFPAAAPDPDVATAAAPVTDGPQE